MQAQKYLQATRSSEPGRVRKLTAGHLQPSAARQLPQSIYCLNAVNNSLGDVAALCYTAEYARGVDRAHRMPGAAPGAGSAYPDPVDRGFHEARVGDPRPRSQTQT